MTSQRSAENGGTSGAIPRSNSAVDLSSGSTGHGSYHARTYSNTSSSVATPPGSALPRPKTNGSTKVTPPPPLSSERSRTRSKGGTSQSQPGSRSGSPSSRFSYMTHAAGGTPGSAGRPRRRSGIPCRSQGASRETSPNRSATGAGLYAHVQSSGYGRERKNSGHRQQRMLTQHTLSKDTNMESALADALARPRIPSSRYALARMTSSLYSV